MIKAHSVILYISLTITGILIPVFFIFHTQTQAQSQEKTLVQPDIQAFDEFKSEQIKLPEKEQVVEFIAVGDIMLSRGVAGKMRKYSYDYPFAKTFEYLKTGDIVFGNLECPIVTGRPVQAKEMRFRADPQVVDALKKAGFTVFSLANNHMPDFGAKGITSTISLLDKAGIHHSGAGENLEQAEKPALFESKGIKFALLAYNDSDVVPDSYEASKNHHGTNIMNIDRMKKSVAEIKKSVDFVIVSMHSGIEYKATPNQRQINFARAAIDAGADLVIGHHPHWVQTIEKYNGKYIIYSLGNFIFDQMWSQETREGLAVKIFISKSGIHKIDFMPVLINDYCQPQFINNEIAEKILDRLQIKLDQRTAICWDNEKKEFIEQWRKAIYKKRDYAVTKKKIIGRGNLDKDQYEESYFLKNGQLWIFEKGDLIWKSKDSWWVDNFFIADSTHDGITDINLSVWRAGNFGSSRPFWVEQNDMGIKNHFFVFSVKGNNVIPIWQSSNLEKPNREFYFDDIDNDGKQELIVIEGTYEKESPYGEYIAIWRWNSWGFFNEWRSRKGKYINLSVETIEGKKFILADSFNIDEER